MAKKDEQLSLQKASDAPGAALLPALADPATDVLEISKALGAEGQIGEFDLQRLRVPTGGGAAWQIETLNGPESRKYVEGVVVARKNARAWWSKPLDEGGGSQPPDCSSHDGVTGEGTPAGQKFGTYLCADCPLSKFGSATKNGQPQRGQACKQSTLLFLMQPDDILPTVLVAPPTSIKPIKQYFLRLLNNRIPYWQVRLRFKLEQTSNAGGIKYSRIAPYIEGKIEENFIPAGALLDRIKVIRRVVEESIMGRVMPEQRDVAGDTE